MILILVADFNAQITHRLQTSAENFLNNKSIQYKTIHVPGAVELPIIAQQLIRKNKNLKAVIALGCVIKGATDHYDMVIRSCTDGLNRVSLDEGIPVIQGVLASPNFELAWQRREAGAQYAETAVKMIEILKS
jgi:6,7-dimethyl-8-ribityllumazine synthase